MLGAPYPLADPSTPLRDPQFQNHSQGNWIPLAKRAISSRLLQGSEGERSFLSVPVSSLKLSPKMQCACSHWKDCSWSEYLKPLGIHGNCLQGGNLPWSQKAFPSVEQSRKKWQIGRFPLWMTFIIKDRHYLDSWKDCPLNWNYCILWLLSMQGKSKNITDFVTENTGICLERCSFQSLSLSLFPYLKKRKWNNDKFTDLL